MTDTMRRWLTVEQAAEYAPCRVRTIRTLIWRGELPRVRFGKRFLIDRLDLDAYLEKHKEREIDPDRPALVAGRKRAETLETRYGRGSKGGLGDGL